MAEEFLDLGVISEHRFGAVAVPDGVGAFVVRDAVQDVDFETWKHGAALPTIPQLNPSVA